MHDFAKDLRGISKALQTRVIESWRVDKKKHNLVMVSSWNFPAQAEPSYEGSEPSYEGSEPSYEGSEPTRAELGHFNF